MGGNTVLIVFFTFSVDIELPSRFYTAWAKTFDLLDSNPMTSSSPPLQVGVRAVVAELELWKPIPYSIYFLQSCTIKRWGMGPQCQNLWTFTRVCTPQSGPFPFLLWCFFVVCNTDNLFFYPSVTHAEKNFAFWDRTCFQAYNSTGVFLLWHTVSWWLRQLQFWKVC